MTWLTLPEQEAMVDTMHYSDRLDQKVQAIHFMYWTDPMSALAQLEAAELSCFPAFPQPPTLVELDNWLCTGEKGGTDYCDPGGQKQMQTRGRRGQRKSGKEKCPSPNWDRASDQ